MDSNERKIVQELITALGCVIPASDGYEPKTNLWNKYSAAKNLLTAAPQVVADGGPDWLGYALELESLTGRVESQTVLRAMESGAHCLRLMGAALAAAPVQPVAVPDALWTLERCNAVCGDGKQCTEACLAAPAAQGDALSVTQIEDSYEGGTCIADPTRLGGTIHLHYISPEHAESAFEIIAEIIDAAIAAKAES